MDHDVNAIVQCESCLVEFEVLARNYEKMVQEDQPILCTDCFNRIMAEHDKADMPERRQFEYMASNAYDLDYLNMIGRDGWEAVTMMENSNLLFKREYVKGL